MVVLIASVLVIKALDLKLYNAPGKVIEWDAINFYSYLPATFVKHDLSLSFIKEDPDHWMKGKFFWPEILPPDSTFLIKTTMGLSMLYCPFFLVAHTLAEPLGYAADGFSPPYAMSLIFACIFWVVLGCVFLRKVLLHRFSETVTTIVLGITVFATNLLWYSTYEAAYSHGFLFGLVSIFLYQTERWHAKPTWWGSIAVGLNLGLITLIRPTDGLVLLYFLLYDITSWKSIGKKIRFYLSHLPMVGAMAAAAVLVWVPQMLYWHWITGSFIFYSYTNNEHFFWTDPKLLQGLFGFRKGWLVYTPVMVFALIGLIPLYQKHRKYFFSTVVFLALNLYVLMSWWCWWYGGSFGQRSMVDCYGLLAVPMAACVEWIFQRKAPLRIALIVVFAGVSYLSFFHYKQYKHGALHHEAMSRAAYFENFGHKRPTERYESLLRWPDYEAAKRGDRRRTM